MIKKKTREKQVKGKKDTGENVWCYLIDAKTRQKKQDEVSVWRKRRERYMQMLSELWSENYNRIKFDTIVIVVNVAVAGFISLLILLQLW